MKFRFLLTIIVGFSLSGAAQGLNEDISTEDIKKIKNIWDNVYNPQYFNNINDKRQQLYVLAHLYSALMHNKKEDELAKYQNFYEENLLKLIRNNVTICLDYADGRNKSVTELTPKIWLLLLKTQYLKNNVNKSLDKTELPKVLHNLICDYLPNSDLRLPKLDVVQLMYALGEHKIALDEVYSIIENLVEFEPDRLILNNHGQWGHTALLFCIQILINHDDKKIFELMKLLIKAGADVNLGYDNGARPRLVGVTPLMLACAQQSNDIVKVLLEAGADIDKNLGFFSAYDYCKIESTRNLLETEKAKRKAAASALAAAGKFGPPGGPAIFGASGQSANLKEKIKGNTVIKFYSTKCNHCKQIKPNVEDLSHQYKNINFLEINAEDDIDSKIANEYGLRALPTLVLINKKKEIKKIVGYKSKQDLKTEFDAFFKE